LVVNLGPEEMARYSRNSLIFGILRRSEEGGHLSRATPLLVAAQVHVGEHRHILLRSTALLAFFNLVGSDAEVGDVREDLYGLVSLVAAADLLALSDAGLHGLPYIFFLGLEIGLLILLGFLQREQMSETWRRLASPSSLGFAFVGLREVELGRVLD